MANGETEIAPYVVCVFALLLVGMLFAKSAPSSDFRMPASAVATFVLLALSICASGPLVSDAAPPYMMNPTGLVPSWDYFFICLLVGVLGAEALSMLLSAFSAQVLQSSRMDTSGARGKLEAFAPVDFVVNGTNTFTHFIIVSHLFAVLLGPAMERRLESFTVLNGPVSFVVAVLFNDFLYWCGHGSMHLRSLYPYVHKQHHRQFTPFRGLADALNVHPFEELLGAALFGFSLQAVASTIGMHAATAWVVFVVWSVFNIMNHFDFDSPMHVPVLFPSGPRDHQMHHRMPNCNYSKLTMFWDRAFGTYRPYSGISEERKSGVESGPRFPLSHALPSPSCVLPLMPAIVLSAVIIEAIRISAIPAAASVLQHMTSSIVFMAVMTTACAVHRKQYQPAKSE